VALGCRGPNSIARTISTIPAKLGFEFSLAQIEVRAIDLQPDLFADWAPMPTAKLPDISLWGGP